MQSRKLSSTNNTALTQNSTSSRTWLAVIALGVSAFSIVTSELAPVGMLSSLAADLHQTEAGTGRVVMAYGWVAAVAALLSGANTHDNFPERPAGGADAHSGDFLHGGDSCYYDEHLYKCSHGRCTRTWGVLGVNRNSSRSTRPC